MPRSFEGRERNSRSEPTSPAWYRRLPPSLQRVARQSDRVTAVPLVADRSLLGATAALRGVLATGRPLDVQACSQGIADGVCRSLRVTPVVVRVRERRPAVHGGELHGLYTPGNGCGRDTVEVWMRTARRDQIVAYRTFLRTLLHELNHHLDYHLLRLQDSLHTTGFYQRESSLFTALGGFEPAGR